MSLQYGGEYSHSLWHPLQLRNLAYRSPLQELTLQVHEFAIGVGV